MSHFKSIHKKVSVGILLANPPSYLSLYPKQMIIAAAGSVICTRGLVKTLQDKYLNTPTIHKELS